MPRRLPTAAAALAAVALFVTTFGASPPPAQSTRVSEYQLKAAVLYNFFQFVEWPASALPAEDTPYGICVLGVDPFGDALIETVNGKRVNGRSIVVQRNQVRGPACHLAFVSASEESRIDNVLQTFDGTPTLTVADFETFASHGGMVTLYTDQTRVRFQINDASARRAGLRISSLLLNLSRPSRKEDRQ